MFDRVALEESGRKLADVDPTLADDDELCAAALALEQLRNRLDAAQGAVLAELDARGTTDARYGQTTVAWLAHHARLARPTARARVAVGVATRRHYPHLHHALVDGRISFDHARALHHATNPRIVDQLAALHPHLIDTAPGTVFEAWRRTLAGLAHHLDLDGGHDPSADPATNRLGIAPTFDGLTHLQGTLVGDAALVTRHAIDTIADELFRQHQRDQAATPDLPIPDRATLRALALAEACRRAMATEPGATAAPRPEVTLVADADAPTTTCHTAEGEPVTEQTAAVLLCDADLVPVTADDDGVPLTMGRRTRTATTHQRRALALRDGGCIFPGCTRPSTWCDAHHIRHWELGGVTDLDNLTSLCRHHHRVTHRPGWTLHTASDGWHWWQTPSGHTFWSQRHHRQRAGPAPPPEP